MCYSSSCKKLFVSNIVIAFLGKVNYKFSKKVIMNSPGTKTSTFLVCATIVLFWKMIGLSSKVSCLM